MPQPHKHKRPKSPRLKLRFGIAAMLTVMLVTTVAASGGSYLWSAAQGKRIGLMVFFPFVLIVPFALMIFVLGSGDTWIMTPTMMIAPNIWGNRPNDEHHKVIGTESAVYEPVI